jgi:hypothetical protein
VRRIILAAIAALALVLGTLAVTETPAAAHHTHSPYTLCSAYRPSGYSLWGYHSHYYGDGHPAAAHCYYRNNATFANYVNCRYYENHAVTSGTRCAH